MGRRFQYIDSLFDGRSIAPVVPAGQVVASITFDNAPHGVYSIVTGNRTSGGVVADFGNWEVRKNGQRKFGLCEATGPQPGFLMILGSSDIISVNAIAAGTAGATYMASIQASLIHEMSTDPSEQPDLMALLSIQQERIGNTLDRIAAFFEGLGMKA